eukprot:TRINITY_DN24635_c0_g1_i1.p1 TRINITY_DN24635_c0_g1~~TRINITY_DN24635_c0_g1_i1.p1  ORF type:complete len:1166 (-),score=251.89 TRINITY_DN24635_c0_g1_i1:139-3345(-)
MQGGLADDTDSSQQELEDQVMKGITDEMQNNNVDKVFEETDPDDNTYFGAFKKKMEELKAWLQTHGKDAVYQRLTSVDKIFCGSANMNDPRCNTKQAFDDWMNSATKYFGSWGWNAESTQDKWNAMADIFSSFRADVPDTSEDFKTDMNIWRKRFPYSSFVSKKDEMPAASSPTSSQRFLVCFGKRVASELHRRPSGRYIMTDQNNLGCHGFWEPDEVEDMLARTVELWKPPTCQMATMVYVIKKKMLMMYAEMSQTLFEALPSIVNDEHLAEQDMLDSAIEGPNPYDPSGVFDNGQYYVDGMRVKALKQVRDPPGCSESWGWSSLMQKERWISSDTEECLYVAEAGSFGTVRTKKGNLAILWDDDSSAQPRKAAGNLLRVVPRDWEAAGTMSSRAWDLVSGVGSSISSGAEKLVDAMYTPRQTALGHLFSGSTSKWIVCPIKNNINLKDLDDQLGVEDAALQDMSKEAYAAWTGYSAALPGEDCKAPAWPGYPKPAFNAKDFPDGESCEISELHADHLEKYTRSDGKLEQFLCPIKTSLPPAEQLNVLLKKDGKCFLHMTSQQQRQFQWPYNGDFPARKQYDRKPNFPSTSYELIKLLKVPGDGMVSYARTCSPDEKAENPRFCGPMKFYNKWPTVAEMAESIGDAAIGSVGMGAASITSAIGDYGTVLSQEGSWKDKGNDAAHLVGEQMWDTLTGAGRLLESTASNAVKSVSYGLPGAAQRDQRLEEEIFGTKDPGLLLHTLSFQESIGASRHTSNSKERYERYVVTMPCPDFNPALEFSAKKTWSAIILKMVQSAVNNKVKDHLFEQPMPELFLRGESRLFLRENRKKADDEWYTYGASVSLGDSSGDVLATCEKSWGFSGLTCLPEDKCESSWGTCVPKAKVSESGWWRADDPTLISAVTKKGDTSGFSVQLSCGPKKSFDAQGGGPKSDAPLEQCLQDGVKANAGIRAKEPWRLYFPDEVVVMATFKDIKQSTCKAESAAKLSSKVCSGAKTDSMAGAHLLAADKKSSDGVYQGIRTGSDFPTGTPYEIVLRPEDLLEAAGIMERLLLSVRNTTSPGTQSAVQ